MKKSLIALAVLAASGAAMAQSSVTLYGRLDASIGQKTTETTGANPVAENDQTVIDHSVLNTTFWGLKGTEDLGGGMKANFKLESGFALDTGVGNTGIFERTATVGLSGGFGDVNLGRQYTAYDTLRGATNNVWDSNLATTGTVWGTGVADYTNRISNSVRYDSPSFGGISGSVAYGFGENETAALDADQSASVHLKYAAGPLLVGVAYQEQKAQNGKLATTDATTGLITAGTAATGSVTTKYALIGGSYDFGVAKLTGSYNQADNSTSEDTEYQVGVSVPFGAFAVAAGYSKATSERSGFADLDGEGYTLVGTYNLSKRTTLYAGYKSTEVESYAAAKAAVAAAPPYAAVKAVNAGVSTTESSQFAVGVRHTF